MRSRVATQRTLNTCEAIGCCELIAETAVFCDRHDAMLQSNTRTVLGKTYRPGAKRSKVFQRTLDAALQEVLFYQTAGYRMPQPANFEW